MKEKKVPNNYYRNLFEMECNIFFKGKRMRESEKVEKKFKVFTHLWNINFFANSYNSMSSAFSFSIFLLCSGVRLFNVVVDTVLLCWSNGIAKRKLNVSSNMYCDICDDAVQRRRCYCFIHIYGNISWFCLYNRWIAYICQRVQRISHKNTAS